MRSTDLLYLMCCLEWDQWIGFSELTQFGTKFYFLKFLIFEDYLFFELPFGCPKVYYMTLIIIGQNLFEIKCFILDFSDTCFVVYL